MLLHRQGLQGRSCVLHRPFKQHPARLVSVRAKQGENEPSSRSRQRKSSASRSPSDEPPAVQVANNMAGQQQDTPPPAVQIANNMAEQQQGGKEADTPSPAVQIANNMAAQQQASKPSTQQQPNPSSSDRRATTPADVMNEGIRAAASTAEEAVARGAEAANEGIALGADLTTQTISAAQNAADSAVSNVASAAEQTITQTISAGEQILTSAAAAVGGAAGAADGAATAARTSSIGGSGSSSAAGSAAVTGSFDTVNVRVPSNMAWANNPPSRGPIRDVTKTQDFDEDEVEDLKIKILAAVASLDRGLAANVREASEVDKLCEQLEDAAGPVTLKWSTSRSSPDASTMDKLAGTWRLIYSSGFNGGSLGGSRPGPPAALVPSVLGQVYQVIDQDKMLLDNVVELLLAYGVPQLSTVLPFLPRPDPEPTPGVRLTLRHTYDVAQPNKVTIVFESTAAKAIGPDILQGLPTFDVPQLPDFLKPPKNFRSASFDVSYLDASMRITRGDRGELRIYLRDKPLETQAPADYVD